jgi:NAD(P)-dependent dehydrogenase (short-subunit alcohol dehydrogenase family)
MSAAPLISLTGKVALVTGGASGIGRASAIAFARAAARVVVADVAADGGEETVALIREAGGEATFVRADVARAVEVADLVARVVAAYGRLDCAHNNAGIEGPVVPLHAYPDDAWERVIDVNLKGVFLCLKAEIRQFLAQDSGGAIVNTASIAGLRNTAYLGAYGASKHGVMSLTKSAGAGYAAQGIRVNAVCPGWIQTDMAERIWEARPNGAEGALAMVPQGRFGQPEEVAQAVVWLCSDAASHVTGTSLTIDGGILA